MSIIFSRACEYSLQAVIYLATQPPNTPVLQPTIAQNLGIPNHFLGKILQQLGRHRIVKSQKGKGGGFLLGIAPEEITLYTIVRIMDGESFLDQCVLGLPDCSDDNPCPVHNEWSRNKNSIIQMLKERTVADLASEIHGKLESIKSTVTTD